MCYKCVGYPSIILYAWIIQSHKIARNMSEKIAMNQTSNHTVNKGRYTESCGENPNINDFLRSEAWEVKFGSWEYHHSIRNRKLPLETDFHLI